VRQAAKDPKTAAIFHNAAQVWNHNFYWSSMAAEGGGEPAGKFRKSIESDFGTLKTSALLLPRPPSESSAAAGCG